LLLPKLHLATKLVNRNCEKIWSRAPSVFHAKYKSKVQDSTVKRFKTTQAHKNKIAKSLRNTCDGKLHQSQTCLWEREFAPEGAFAKIPESLISAPSS
jgi:hypothetical protein